MAAAIEAARRVRGTTGSNPGVGAVVVRDGTIVAIGATSPPPAGMHAEAAAIVAAGESARGADVYVTLEPCFPFEGKRTPPCSQALIDAGVRRVAVALEDPDPGVRGRGIALLRAAGIEVEVGDGREAATAVHRPYLKQRLTGLPYVIAKFAASLDGRIATRTGDSQWITGPEARDLGHEQRAWIDAIMVGSGTVLADNPSLTARPGGVEAARQPVRIVLDARGRVDPSAAVFHGPGHAIVATSDEAPPAWKREIAATGAHVIDCERTAIGIELDQLLPALARRGIVSVWVEGGGTLLGSLFDAGHVDEVWAFLAPVIIGGGGLPAVGGEGPARLADAWRLRGEVVESIGRDILVRGYTGGFDP